MASPWTTLPVGSPARRGLGPALWGTWLVGCLFVLWTWASKEVPTLYAQSPWRDDPYDAVVSFALFFMPLLLGLAALRAPLCRGIKPLPLQRANDLLRVGRGLVAVMLAVIVSDWVSVVVGPADATEPAPVLIDLLAGFSVLSLLVAAALHRAGRTLRGRTAVSGQPDWLTDVLVLAERLAAQPVRGHAWAAATPLRWLAQVLVAPTRRRPLRAAATVALLFAGGLVTGQAAAEGYTVGTAALLMAVSASGMFAFLAGAGSYLRLIGPPTGPPRPFTRALVAGCAAAPLALAFREPLWGLIGTAAGRPALPQLAGLVLLATGATGALVLAATLLMARHR